ncbi:MAG: outer membrane beta-barrel protein [Burkholderiales bacterium]
MRVRCRCPYMNRGLILCGLALLLSVVTPAAAFAQQREPVGPFAVDVRGALARFKEDAAVAATLDVDPSNLPTRGLGLAAGAHWYPLRRGRISLGIGGEILWARDSRTGETEENATAPAPTVTTRLSMLSPHVSLNFGHRDGWSYISGGIGRASLTAERNDVSYPGDAGQTRMTHYGGGARWFTGPHLAFTFDVRFYTINATPAAGTRPAFPRTRMMVISAGVSLR